VQSNIIYTTNCKYRTDATPYTIETWFKYIIVNTLHKDDNKYNNKDDDDNDNDNNNNNNNERRKMD
jgi:hypothetical protein